MKVNFWSRLQVCKRSFAILSLDKLFVSSPKTNFKRDKKHLERRSPKSMLPLVSYAIAEKYAKRFSSVKISIWKAFTEYHNMAYYGTYFQQISSWKGLHRIPYGIRYHRFHGFTDFTEYHMVFGERLFKYLFADHARKSFSLAPSNGKTVVFHWQFYKHSDPAELRSSLACRNWNMGT